MFLMLYVYSLRKVNYNFFFLLNFLSKFIDVYLIDTVLSLIMLVSQMLKIQRDNVEEISLKTLLL